MIFQDPTGALNPRHTIYEAVAEGLRIHKVAGDEPALVADALSRAGLRPPERFLQRYPHEVSGGQRQRVLIAGAMALEPQLLLADEPVSSLDASVRGEILRVDARARATRHGVAILAVTHDLGLAWNIADRVAVMYLGRIVELGATEQVLSDPQHPYTRALLSVVPEKERMEQQILVGETPDPRRIPSGCRFHPRCPLVAVGRVGATRDRASAAAARSGARPVRRRRGPRRGLPRPAVARDLREPPRDDAVRSAARAARCRTLADLVGDARSMTTWYASASDCTSRCASVTHVASGQRDPVRARAPSPTRPPGSTVETPSSPSYSSLDVRTVQPS